MGSLTTPSAVIVPDPKVLTWDSGAGAERDRNCTEIQTKGGNTGGTMGLGIYQKALEHSRAF
jgi:hypothetical protein